MFAWAPYDILPVINTKVVSHRLAICLPSKIVAQRKRKVGEEKKVVIDKEVGKLSDVGFKETKYSTWIANVVLVRKENNI